MSSGKEDDDASANARDTSASDQPGLSPRFVSSEQLLGASPELHFTLEQLMNAQKTFEDLAIMHEIATDDDFTLSSPAEPGAAASSPRAALEQQVRQVVHRAFWDSLREKLEREPADYSHALVLIQEIKELLNSLLLPQHGRLRAEFDEVLDLALIRQKIENDAFDLKWYANYSVTRMAMLCAPARDEQVAALRGIDDPVELFRGIFSLLEVMQMDMANFTIQQMKPYIQQQAVDLERGKFETLLAQQRAVGVDGLRRSRGWLRAGLAALVQQQQQRGATAGTSQSSPKTVLAEAYLLLMDWRRPLTDEEIFPETLAVDAARLVGLRAALQRLHLLCSVLLVTQGVFGLRVAEDHAFKCSLKEKLAVVLADTPLLTPGHSPASSPREPLAGAAAAKDVEQQLRDKMDGVLQLLTKEVDAQLRARGGSGVAEQERALLAGQLAEVPYGQVAELLRRRLLDFLRVGLLSDHQQALRVPAGLSVAEKELSQVTGAVLRIFAYNRAVFGRHYDTMVAPLLQDEGPPQPAE